MTLKEFMNYLSWHSGYNFSKTTYNDDYLMHFANDFRGFITEEDGKFYLLVYHDDGGVPITKNKYVVCTHKLSYRFNHYYIRSLYEISIPKSQARYLE